MESYPLSERLHLRVSLKEVLSLNESAEVIAGILIFIGTLISLISALGLVRLPDVYTRSHAASKKLNCRCIIYPDWNLTLIFLFQKATSVFA